MASVQKALGCLTVTATVLANRRIQSGPEARDFMDTALSRLRPPFSMKDMEKAVCRIADAILGREKILIFGDYDVDGVTSTAILLEFLQYAGADVTFYIPHRTREGYDLQVHHIFGHALPNSVDLIITVDCGSTRHEAVQAAREIGIDVIITDHHTIAAPPPAVAVVNPRRQDCTAGFGHLAGVGVAFSLLICLRKHLRDLGFWATRPEPNLKAFCDLVALGTVADMVPLVDENRILAQIGLGVINTGQRAGISALTRATGIEPHTASSDDIAFRLAPRINAAGRLSHARKAVELLTTRQPERAEEIAQELNRMNRVRQETEKRMLEKILDRIKKHPEILDKKALVLTGGDWHEGVLGIVAAKLVEKFFRPVILISTRNGMGKGSGRSIPGISIYRGIEAGAEFLEKFGGHPMAAGLEIRPDQIEPFSAQFEAAISAASRPENLSKIIPIDCELRFRDIPDRLIDELESLGPFGTGNPEPLFLARNVRVSSSKIIGRHHRRMTLKQFGDDSCTVPAIQFNVDRNRLENTFERIAFRLRWNRWNGRKTAQIIIEET
ncbi:single-stranded-DNA-specific exonuclease RecJ [Desulfonema ishimotonii]|uniref:single-stranded-DNA-specific exonuclease RecJ n=1 Tax=Desulfonema ishimotonii TaxID=45657 RepID=UPI00140BE29E|nr:single-stranded-DNA-specific exonuclease RecJ [Desulfonema ishimotonii]